MMKRKLLLYSILILITLQIGFGVVETHQVQARNQWGVPMGDCYVQVFVVGSDGYSYPIPQYYHQLNQQKFSIEMDCPDSKPRNITIQMFSYEKIPDQQWNASQQKYITTYRQGYINLVQQRNFTLQRGVNPDHDWRYAQIDISNTNFPALQPDKTQYLFKILYKNAEPYEFYKKTDFGQIPVTKTNAQYGMELVFNLLILGICAFLGLPCGAWLYHKTGTIYPKFPISTILLIITWLSMVWIYTVVDTSTATYGFDPVRNLTNTPVMSIDVAVFFIFAIITPGFFTPDHYAETEIIQLKLRYRDPTELTKLLESGVIDHTGKIITDDLTKIPTIKKIKIYSFKDKKSEADQYARNPNSWFDLINRLIRGGMKINFYNSATFKNENKKDQSIFVSDIIEHNEQFLTPQIRKLIYFVLLASIFFSLALIGVHFLVTFVWLFGLVFIVASFLLVVFFFWEKYAQDYSLDVLPIRANALAVALTVENANELQSANDFLVAKVDALDRKFKLTYWKKKGAHVVDWELDVWRDNFTTLFDDTLADLWEKRSNEPNNKTKQKNADEIILEKRKQREKFESVQ